MITKFVLVVWIGMGQTQTISIQSYKTLAECDAVAKVLETEVDRIGWFKCLPYTFDSDDYRLE
jgi:hypothetical protein